MSSPGARRRNRSVSLTTMRRTRKSHALVLALALLLGGHALGQGSAAPTTGRPAKSPERWDPALAFLAPYGIQNFSAHYVDALRSLLDAREQYDSSDYAGAQATLAGLWSRHPVAHPSWGTLPTQPFGINIGSPPCYYALRMLTDMTEWRVAHPGQPPAPRTARLTVLVVGRSHGIEPRNLAELNAGTGIPVTHQLDERVEHAGYRAVHESLRLFEEYALAITQGKLDVETRILQLPELDLPVHAGVNGGRYFAGLVDAAQVFASVPQAEIEATDWWWILYPSHVPEQYPDFQHAEFVTGGMGVGAEGFSPFFIIDDRWIVRKPPHIGTGEYSDVERRVYLPQWFQHEFFHHLFRTSPEFGLENTPHQWFDRSTWPSDFTGRYEADYYHEALYKRLRRATPGLHSALRYATADAPWAQIGIGDVLGNYRREPVQNAWHIGDILFSGTQLQWRNTAPVSWNLFEDLSHGVLATGPDCPYYDNSLGRKFNIVLVRDAIGDLTPQVRGFAFMGELYRRQ